MTEAAHRAQIERMRREQAAGLPPPPAPMSDEEAARLVAEHGSFSQEQVGAAALIAKLVQGNMNDLRKQAMGGMKIPSVDFSKVMPSSVAKAMAAQGAPPIPRGPVAPPPIPGLESGVPGLPMIPEGPMTVPGTVPEMIPEMTLPPDPLETKTSPGNEDPGWTPAAPTTVHFNLPPGQPLNESREVDETGQIEMDFDRQAKYEDIMKAVEKLEDRAIMQTAQLKEILALLESLHKKKLNRRAPHGKDISTQAG